MAQIETRLGLIDESELEKTEGIIDNEDEYTTWVEYRLKEDTSREVIHRSAHVTLKKFPYLGVQFAKIG